MRRRRLLLARRLERRLRLRGRGHTPDGRDDAQLLLPTASTTTPWRPLPATAPPTYLTTLFITLTLFKISLRKYRTIE